MLKCDHEEFFSCRYGSLGMLTSVQSNGTFIKVKVITFLKVILMTFKGQIL